MVQVRDELNRAGNHGKDLGYFRELTRRRLRCHNPDPKRSFNRSPDFPDTLDPIS